MRILDRVHGRVKNGLTSDVDEVILNYCKHCSYFQNRLMNFCRWNACNLENTCKVDWKLIVPPSKFKKKDPDMVLAVMYCENIR